MARNRITYSFLQIKNIKKLNMKKTLITSIIVLSATFFAASVNKTSKQNKTKVTTSSTINSIHNGNELASAD